MIDRVRQTPTIGAMFDGLMRDGAGRADGAAGLEAAVSQALVDDIGERPPWYVRVLIGAGTWVGASMLALFLVLTQVMEFIVESSPGRLLGGALFLTGATLASRRLRGDLATQVTLIGSLVGQGLWLWEVAEQTKDATPAVIAMVLLQLLAIIAFRDTLHRFLSTVVLVGGLLALVALETVPLGAELVTTLTAGCAVTVWLLEVQLCTRAGSSRWWRPIGYGLLVATFGLLLFQAVLTIIASLSGAVGSVDAQLLAMLPTGMAVPFLALALLVIVVAAREAGPAASTPPVILAFGGALAIGLLTWNVPGVMAALVLLALGQLRGDRVIRGLSITFLGMFLFIFYYQMDTTLLSKSLWVMTGGAGFLVLRALIRYVSAGENGEGVRRRLTDVRRPLALAGATILVLGITGAQVLQKERILMNGETVLLRLAPKDPRSLMQGDYMVLRYQLASQLEKPEELPLDGFLVVATDEQGIAHFVRVHQSGLPLGADERLLRYRRRGNDEVRLGAESFFFEEGQGERFAAARYGELKLDTSGDSVLVGLRGEDLKPL